MEAKWTFLLFSLFHLVFSQYDIDEIGKTIDEIEANIAELAKPDLGEWPASCKELQKREVSLSGIYKIYHFSGLTTVYCDMDRLGGGWLYVLNRFNGSLNFNRPLSIYSEGLGAVNYEYFADLDFLNVLTAYQPTELLVDLVDWDNQTAYAYYDGFSVGSYEEGYPIKFLGEYNGTAGDSLRYHVGARFVQHNRSFSCGTNTTFAAGSWWFRNCSTSYLTGVYKEGEVTEELDSKVMFWDSFRGSSYGLKEARMMVRPKADP